MHHHHHQSHHIHAPKIKFPSIKHHPIHIGKVHIGKPISFKEFIGGTNSVIKTITSPTRDLIHGVEHGLGSFGKGIGTVGQSLTTPLIIVGGIALVYFVTKK